MFSKATIIREKKDQDEANSGEKRTAKDLMDAGWEDRGHYFRIKKKKLDEQWQGPGSVASSGLEPTTSSSTSSKLLSNIFEGLVMNIDGFTEPSSVVLIGLITQHGGSYRQYFDSSVTHLLACELAHSKLKEMAKKKNPPHIVHPRWILDCVKANCLLSIKDYMIIDNTRNTIQHKDLRSFTNVNKNMNIVAPPKEISSPKSPSKLTSSINSTLSPSKLTNSSKPTLDTTNLTTIKPTSNSNTPNPPKSTLRIKKKTPQPQPAEAPPKPQVFKIPQPKIPFQSPQPIVPLQNDPSEEHPTKDLVTSAAEDPNFISNYMKNSRLHFISSWRNKQKQNNPTFSGIERKGIFVVHIDMDCFFASIAMRDNPSLREKPIAVSYSKDGQGDVSSANYCARTFGVRAGMWMKRAKELCPELIAVPYEFEKYEKAASKVQAILNNHCERVKIMSIDEAFIEITKELPNKTVEELETLVAAIRSEIEKETGCTASAGMSTNQLLARIATKTAKPNGQFYLDPNEAVSHIEKLDIDEIPTVGWKTKKHFNDMGIFKCMELIKYTRSEMQELLGDKKGDTLYDYLRGVDKRSFFDTSPRKSVGVEVNYGIRFTKMEEVTEFIDKLSLEVSNRLKEEKIKGKAIVLKVKKRKEGAPEAAKYLGHGICDNFSKSCTVPYFTDDSSAISRAVKDLYKQLEVRSILIQN